MAVINIGLNLNHIYYGCGVKQHSFEMSPDTQTRYNRCVGKNSCKDETNEPICYSFYNPNFLTLHSEFYILPKYTTGPRSLVSHTPVSHWLHPSLYPIDVYISYSHVFLSISSHFLAFFEFFVLFLVHSFTSLSFSFFFNTSYHSLSSFFYVLSFFFDCFTSHYFDQFFFFFAIYFLSSSYSLILLFVFLF